jgi:hypothetical protein
MTTEAGGHVATSADGGAFLSSVWGPDTRQVTPDSSQPCNEWTIRFPDASGVVDEVSGEVFFPEADRRLLPRGGNTFCRETARISALLALHSRLLPIRNTWPSGCRAQSSGFRRHKIVAVEARAMSRTRCGYRLTHESPPSRKRFGAQAPDGQDVRGAMR